MSLIDPTLAAILVCPACRGELEEVPADTVLRCATCGLRYPVVDGVPVMLVDRAERP